MRAITDHYEPGVAAVRALQAGVDLLNVVGPIASQRQMFKAALSAIGTTISQDRLDVSVRGFCERSPGSVSLSRPAPTWWLDRIAAWRPDRATGPALR